MADEKVVPAGTPIIINTSAPAKSDEPSQLRDGREKREAELAEARSKGANDILKSLGVKKSERARLVEEIKAGRMKIAEVKQEAEAAKTQAAEAKAEADAFKPYKDQVDQLTQALREYADAEFAQLPEPLQKSIVDMKLDDPRQRLDMIKVFKKNGVIGLKPSEATGGNSQVATEKKTETPKAEAKKPNPSTTMASSPKGSDAPGGQSLNYYETWRQLKDSGQDFLAAQYLNLHMVKVMEQRPKNS
jgi:hypothetical protein